MAGGAIHSAVGYCTVLGAQFFKAEVESMGRYLNNIPGLTGMEQKVAIVRMMECVERHEAERVEANVDDLGGF